MGILALFIFLAILGGICLVPAILVHYKLKGSESNRWLWTILTFIGSLIIVVGVLVLIIMNLEWGR